MQEFFKENYPLHVAIRSNRLLDVETMVTSYDLEEKDSEQGHTALEEAIHSGASEKIVNILLKNGAIITAQAVMHSCSCKNYENLKVLLARKPEMVNCQDYFGNTPLAMAVASGDIEKVKYLLHLGAITNVVNRWGETPLHQAVSYGYEGIAEELVKAGVPVNTRENKYGDTPLHTVFRKGQYRKTNLYCIVAHNNNVDSNLLEISRNIEGLTPKQLGEKLEEEEKREKERRAKMTEEEAEEELIKMIC